MSKLNLKVNEKIEILEDNLSYKSNIQDVNEKGLIIDIPISGTKYYIMHVGSILEFYYCTEKDVIKYRSVVLGKKIEQNLQLVILSTPEEIERVQRREYFRLPISMSVKYYLLPENKAYLNLEDIPSGYFKQLKDTMTIDISGGGMKIITKEMGRKWQNVLLSISIPEEINLICTIIRVENNVGNNNYKTALKYTNIEEKLRDRIIKFIFAKLREQSRLLK